MYSENNFKSANLTKPRARDLGVPFEGIPGKWNAITDVAGVEVGYSTIVTGEEVRTGVTAILPRGKLNNDPVFGAWFPLNGNGEMTGSAWLEESGFLEGPVMITNTHSVGVVRDAVISWQVAGKRMFQPWSNPVIAETFDGFLNDINGFHVRPEHVLAALEQAQSGPVEEGNVGGGTGMVCFEFKGGTGSSSRILPLAFGGWTVGVLVQANFGRRSQLSIAGVPVGKLIRENAPFTDGRDAFEDTFEEHGSIIAVLATDAPLLPHQLKRLAKRAAIGIARTGGMSGNGSGDIFLAFSTANFSAANAGATGSPGGIAQLQALDNQHIDPLLWASAYCVEEAIVNTLVAATTMVGFKKHTVHAIPRDRLREIFNPNKDETIK